MAKTKYSDFKAEVLSTGGYRTHAENRAPKRMKPCALATFLQAYSVLRSFFLCAVYEAIGRLTFKRWTEDFCFGTVTIPESRLGMNVILEGFAERAAYKGPVLYLCNHLSSTETILLPSVFSCFGTFSYVAKESLSRLPFLGEAARHMRMVPVGRVSPREDLMTVLKVGVERIQGGDSFLIFPQGTRDRVFSRRKYSSIGAKLAERAGCPVVPLVVDTRSQTRRDSGFLSKLFRDFGPTDTSRDIRVACGPVIPAGKAKDLHEQAFDWMAGKLEEWGMPTER